ncbi:hypothetical protein MTR67_011963 [Solanum verrucosum]|uniref:Putative plant transposon protein domain-containing protein n=1 Tax=Solanum verrucosum TaxID=315347 RepID=A0AAF0TJU4_SOLVR|nr:hypothetical protein MTR67_011963 [Solanum verrucosum]
MSSSSGVRIPALIQFPPQLLTPLVLVRPMTLEVSAKNFLSIIRTRISPTQADKVVTWDQAVMLAAIMVGLEIDFSCILITEIHERVFWRTTIMPFPCLIFHLCRDILVPVWHCDRLTEATKTIDVGLIKEDADPVALRKGIYIELPPMGDDTIIDFKKV